MVRRKQPHPRRIVVRPPTPDTVVYEFMSSSSANTNANVFAFTDDGTGPPHPRTSSRLGVDSAPIRRDLDRDFQRVAPQPAVLVLGMSNEEHARLIAAAMNRPQPARRVEAVIDLTEGQ